MQFTLENAILRKNNNFDLIRLIAALAVIFGHSFYLFPPYGHDEPVKHVLINDYSGSLSVYTFFFLSGIFITSSFKNSKSYVNFILMRIFRIWPALIVCIIITVFIIGPVFTDTSLHNFFFERQTWRYLIKNMIMLNYEPKLNNLFQTNLLSKATNGSLWTLPAEIRCYCMVFLFGVFSLLDRKVFSILIFIFFFLFRNNSFLVKLFVEPELVKFMLFFLAGMVSYTFRKNILIDYKIAIVLCIGSVITYFMNLNLFMGVFYVTLIYSILVLATADLIIRIKLPGDYSYGIYIYGFLVQQIIDHLYPYLSSYKSLLITIPLTFLLGFISWHTIELPLIDFGKKIKKRREVKNIDINPAKV